MKNKRLREIFAFATSLETRLGDPNLLTLVDDESVEKLRRHVELAYRYCQKPKHDPEPDINEMLGRLGIAIWNHTSRVMRDAPDRATGVLLKKTAVYSRVLAFHLLDAAHNAKAAHTLADVVWLMKRALKAAKTALGESELAVTLFVLQKAAEYIRQLTDKNHTPLKLEEAKDIDETEMEYYTLRTALSWREDSLDVADHMYNKARGAGITLGPHVAERLADVVFEIGRDMRTKKQYDMAETWLERAHETISSCDLEHLNRDALVLRTAILQTLVLTLINVNTTKSLQRAENLIELMVSESGTTMAALTLRLDLLNNTPPETFDSTSYASVLAQMIDSLRQADIDMEPVEKKDTDLNFKHISSHVEKLHGRNPALAADVLDKFISAVSKTNHDNWMERLVIRRIWMATLKADSLHSVKAVKTAVARIKNPLSAEGTRAAQTLIWKATSSVYNQNLFDVASAWCQLALHRIFEKTDLANRARIERKQMLCALARGDFDAARSIHLSMAAGTKQEPETWYLMYKVAIGTADQDLATRCLEGVSKVPNSTEYLYSCCLDAQSGNGDFVQACMVKLLDEARHVSPSPVQLPAMLRCLVRVYIKDYERAKEEDKRTAVAAEICDIFKSAVEHISNDVRDAQGNKLFDIRELDWFGRNSYDLGVKYLTEWNFSFIIKILTLCMATMSHYPHDISSGIAADLKLRELFCNFMVASVLLARARTKDNIEIQLQDYLQMRKHIAAFDSEVPAQLVVLTGEAREDMLRKQASLQGFDFEGAVRLKDWESLGQIVAKVREYNSAATLKGMADCILRHDAPGQVTYSTIRKIIDQIWLRQSMPVSDVLRYIRCQFQVTLTYEDDLALSLATEYDRLLSAAKEADVHLPMEEVEWFATLSFNHAIEFYHAGKNELCKQWVFKAFELARQLGDGNSLERVMHDQYKKLIFDRSNMADDNGTG